LARGGDAAGARGDRNARALTQQRAPAPAPRPIPPPPIPPSFADLNNDIPAPTGGKTEFFPCMADSDATVAFKTMDPLLAAQAARGGGGSFQAPAVRPPGGGEP
jgi:hypothetical protein